jgi:hypothetical protein
MIVFDYRHTAIRNLMALCRELGKVELEEGLLRHMILNSIRSINSKHRRQYGELVLACEGGQLWRRAAFPYYKANRKKAKDESLIDWKKVDELFDQITAEIQTYFQYRVVKVPGAEGDDVIASLVHETCMQELSAQDHPETWLQSPDSEKVLIVSSDGDFAQLLRHPNVRQWDPIKQRFVEDPNPLRSLKEKIIRGDSGDGIPNVLSDDDCLVSGKRQKSIFQTKLSGWLDQEPREFCDPDKWERNDRLINFDRIPAGVRADVLDKYRQEGGKPKGHIVDYLMQFRLRNLTEYAADF